MFILGEEKHMQVDLGNKEIKLTSDDLIVTETDEKGIISFASRDFCRIAGYSKEELIGQPHNFVRNSFMPKSAFKDLWDTVKSGNIWTGIVVNKTKDGGYYWVKANVYPSQNRDGSRKYISVRILPSQREIEEAIKLYQTLD